MARRWALVAAFLALTVSGSAPTASARPRPRDYIGFYQRTYSAPDGHVKVNMEVRSDRTAVIHRLSPTGRDVEKVGSWTIRDGNLVVMLPRGGSLSYRIHGRDLQKVGDKHVFFRKQ